MSDVNPADRKRKWLFRAYIAAFWLLVGAVVYLSF